MKIEAVKFTMGERVRLSPEGKAIFTRRRSSTGTVVGFSYDRTCIKVKRDGYVTVEPYHVDFWEPELVEVNEPVNSESPDSKNSASEQD